MQATKVEIRDSKEDYEDTHKVLKGSRLKLLGGCLTGTRVWNVLGVSRV
jgi:hypothetical protein